MEREFSVSSIEHLLMIVPHQDDEILMGAGLIYELLQQQKKVTVVLATNGDYGCPDYTKGRTRLKESLNSLKVLGLSPEQVIFLGYADTGMPREESFLTALYHAVDPDQVYASGASAVTYGLEEKPEFHFENCREHGFYTRNTFLWDLQRLLVQECPDCVLTTHSLDMHGDHEALFYFVREALKKVEKTVRPRLLVGMVHSPEGDERWPLRGTPVFTCPEGIEEGGLKWEERLVLPLRESLRGGLRDGNLKYEALKKHETALEPNAVDYLMAFIKDEELFWEIREP